MAGSKCSDSNDIDKAFTKIKSSKNAQAEPLSERHTGAAHARVPSLTVVEAAIRRRKLKSEGSGTGAARNSQRKLLRGARTIQITRRNSEPFSSPTHPPRRRDVFPHIEARREPAHRPTVENSME